MNEFLDIHCPHCGEAFSVALDMGEDDSAEFITDCEVCCRPMTVIVRFQNGEIADITVRAD